MKCVISATIPERETHYVRAFHQGKVEAVCLSGTAYSQGLIQDASLRHIDCLSPNMLYPFPDTQRQKERSADT